MWNCSYIHFGYGLWSSVHGYWMKGADSIRWITGRFQGPDPGKLHVISAVSQTQAADRRRRGKKMKKS